MVSGDVTLATSLHNIIMKVKYLGKIKTLAFKEGKVYEVISIEKGWYRIMTELDEDYLFPPKLFEIVEP